MINKIINGIETKIAVDEDMLINLAKIAINKTVDTGAYLLRKSPAGKYSANETIIGGTVAWNQLVQNGNFASASGWTVESAATLSVNNNEATVVNTNARHGIYQNIHTDDGHKYFASLYVKKATSGNVDIAVAGNSIVNFAVGTNYVNFTTIVTKGTSTSRVGVYSTEANSTVYIKNIICIDLTLALGTTIADYIYSLESSTAGTGVAKLNEWGFLSKGYYAYDTGTLRSVNTSGKKVVDKNLVNPNTIITGYYNGNTLINDNNYRTSELISAIPNTTYSFSIYNKTTLERVNSLVVDEWDGDRKWIANHTSVNTIITLPNCMYLTVRNYYAQASLITSDNFLYQLEISSEPSAYELYEGHTYTLPSIDLRGIPKLDSSNNLYYDGDIYESTGKVTRKYDIVDLGTLNWEATNSSVSGIYGMAAGGLTSKIKAQSDDNTKSNLACAKYVSISRNMEYTNNIGVAVNSSGYIHIYDPNYNTSSSASAFKTAMSGVYLVYELATLTSETISSFANDTPVTPDGIEEFIDNRDVPIPVGHNTKYGDNEFIGEVLGISSAQERIDNLIKVKEIDISGVAVTQMDNGIYYAAIDTSLPNGSKIISINWKGPSWTSRVWFIANDYNGKIIIQSATSLTIGSSKFIDIYYI